MQKALRIRLQTARSSMKTTDKNKLRVARKEYIEYQRAEQQRQSKLQTFVNDERKARREDWIMGPLAPNRDHGRQKGRYGTLTYSDMQLPKVTRQKKGIPHRSNEAYQNTFGFQGKTMVGNVAPGDRVAVVNGSAHIKGKIGFVLNVDENAEAVRIANVGVADVTHPDYLKVPVDPKNPDSQYFTPQEMLIPMKDVRLVAQITDHEGNIKDVLVRHVHADGPYQDRPRDSPVPNHTRYISGTAHLTGTGTDIVIPWPSDKGDVEDLDTEAPGVTAETWSPSMYYPPLGYLPDSENNATYFLKSKDEEGNYSPYYVGDRQGVPASDLSSIDRAGFLGIEHMSADYQIWIDRVHDGITQELAGRNSRRMNDFDTIRSNILADARSHWFEQRQTLSPQAEAQLRKVEQRSATRQAAIEKNTQILTDNVQDLIESVRTLKARSSFKPDPKLRKTLAHETKAVQPSIDM